MHDAGLHRRLGEDRLDRFGEALEAVDAADQDVVDAAGLQVGQHLHPELGALVVLEPHAEHLAVAVDRDRERQVAGLALHRAAVTDLQDERVEEHDRVDVVQWPGLPGAGVFHDRVGHPADQVAADLDPVDLLQVRLDVSGREAAAVERQDLVVEPFEPPLPLPDDLRLECPLAVPGRLDPHLAMLGEKRLRRRPVPRVPCPASRLLVRLEPEVVGQLDLQRPLHQPLGQLREQPAAAGDLLLRPSPSKQLVDHLVRQKRLHVLGELRPQRRRARRASAPLRSPSGLAPLHAGATRLTGLIQPAWDSR